MRGPKSSQKRKTQPDAEGNKKHYPVPAAPVPAEALPAEAVPEVAAAPGPPGPPDQDAPPLQ